MKRIVVGLLAIVFVLLGAASFFVWLPDVLSDREIVVARTSVRDGEFVELTQAWAGDGYLTAVRHCLPSGMKLIAVGDGDTSKAWNARMDHNTNAASVRIRFNKKDWLYQYDSRSLVINGRPRQAE
jgi:hypothetical protein